MKTFIHTHSRRFACFLAAALLAPLCGCVRVTYSSTSSSSSSADYRAVTNRVLAGDISASLKSLDVDNRFGFIHVLPASDDAFSWTWKLTVGAATDALALKAATAAGCQAVQDGDHLRLVVSLPNGVNNAHFQSDLEIRVPKSVAVRTRTHFGETRIAGIAGDVEAIGQNGAMELRDLGGKVRAQTSFAALILKGSGPATLKNQNGSIDASDIHGTLDAQTSFATLTAADIGGAVKLRDQNGRIEAARVTGDADIKTSFAALRAEDIDGAATLAGQNGRIEAIRIKGNTDVKTSFAEAHVENIAGNLTVANQNGRVVVSHVTGAIQARTSFAAMEIEGAGREFTCRNQNGAINLRVTSREFAAIDAETSFAPIEVRLPSGLKPAVQARTSFADIESDFPVLMRPRGQDPFVDVEAGTPRVRLQDQNGRIRITSEKLAER